MKQVQEIIAIMFLTREYAHREHLKTESDEYHRALSMLYAGIGDIADEFAETWMGLYGERIGNIPYRLAKTGEVDDVIESQMTAIEDLRDSLDGPRDRPLQNIIDTAISLYAKTLFLLRNLK